MKVVSAGLQEQRSWNNSCRGSGGALASVGVVDLKPGTSLFASNAAENAGGAAFISGAGVGPVFVQATFTCNTSPRGGAVYSASSGTTQDEITRQVFPTTFEDCSFTDNRASTSGGAIESVAGDDMFVKHNLQGKHGRYWRRTTTRWLRQFDKLYLH